MIKTLMIKGALESARLTQRILVDQDYEVVLAATGEEGINQAKEHHPDMILFDLGLPDCEQEIVAQQLRADVRFDETPAIVVSTWPEFAIKRITEDYGFNEYIRKPYDGDSFVAVIKSHLVI
jgi:DNA-binding response OmpR family regulator